MPGEEIALSRYFSIRKGKALPFFKVCRKIECARKDSLPEMWEEHSRAMEIFREEKKNEFRNLKNRKDAYFSLLDLKYGIAMELLRECIFCERRCKADRAAGKLGWCRVGKESRVATMFPHWGEENCLIPSGTIFFSGCNWSCVYCQNWDISQFPEKGEAMGGKEIAEWIDGEAKGGRVVNANFVGGEPTPNLHTVIDAARHMETNTPLVWNSNMYMSMEGMKLLEGVVDVYLADFRYGRDECALRLSNVPNYMKTMERNFRAAVENAEVLVRILVLPNHTECCAKNILRWIGENINERAYVNLMSQYHPRWRAKEFPDVARALESKEFSRAVGHLRESGIKYYEIQG